MNKLDVIETFAMNLAKTRYENGFTQKTFAAKLDMPLQTYRRYEYGNVTKIEFETIEKLYLLTGMYIEELIGIDADEIQVMHEIRHLPPDKRDYIRLTINMLK